MKQIVMYLFHSWSVISKVWVQDCHCNEQMKEETKQLNLYFGIRIFSTPDI
jgi:hypothetical protein